MAATWRYLTANVYGSYVKTYWRRVNGMPVGIGNNNAEQNVMPASDGDERRGVAGNITDNQPVGDNWW